MDLKQLYVVVYKVQDRENFAPNLYVLISRESFLTVHKDCKRLREHLQPGAKHFHYIVIDGVTVGWSFALNGDCYCSGRLCFAPQRK